MSGGRCIRHCHAIRTLCSKFSWGFSSGPGLAYVLGIWRLISTVLEEFKALCQTLKNQGS